ncbi:molybdenum cofactor biosynthesis protein MoaE, partial [Burkholderia sp. SIMBA_042]
RWQLEAVRIVHRVGRIPLGQPVVIVVVAAAHRASAFDACEFIMDFVKTHAPFWKKEIRHDGVSGWVEPKAHDDQAMRRWG